MEDGYTAERSTGPLFKICFELRIECLDEWAHEWYLERRSSDRTLSLDVHDSRRRQLEAYSVNPILITLVIDHHAE